MYSSGGFDTATGEGVMEARIRAAVDAEEVEKLKRRVRRKTAELAAAGKVGGGGTRPFGFDDDRVTVRDDEAVLIREAVDAILAGDSLRSVMHRWNGRGVTTTTGRTWVTPVLRRMLTSPRIAGLRQHQGEVIGDAEWKAIVPREKWERVRAILTDPARRTNCADLGRRYLLTGGLAFCGVEGCGKPLVARPKPGGRRAYICSPDTGGCNGIRIMADDFEAFVGEAVCEALASPEIAHGLMVAADGSDDEAALHEALRNDEELIRSYEREAAERGLSPASFFTFRATVEERMAETRRRLAERSGSNVLVSIPTGEVRDAWAAGSLDWRRSLVSAVVKRVVVARAMKGRNFFDPNRVVMEWRA